MAFLYGDVFMKIYRGDLFTVALALLVICGATACASKEKAATGPNANRAEESKQAAAHGTTEVPPNVQELNRQQAEEAARLKQSELDGLKAEEAARAAANVLALDKLAKAYFDFDKYEIKPDYRTPLANDAALVKSHSNAKVVVEGHCDERGSESYNLALGERRAASVKKYLVSLGVNEDRIHTISYGSERPAENGHDEKAWSQNRRVQFSQE